MQKNPKRVQYNKRWQDKDTQLICIIDKAMIPLFYPNESIQINS